MVLVVNCLGCKYLNKRLGGLKLLTDWVARVEKYHAHPSGLQINRSSLPSSGTGKSSEELALEARGMGAVSYTVVPLTATTPLLLGSWMQTCDLLTPLLLGEEAHLSLIQRSKEVLKFLSRHGLLTDSFIQSLFQMGGGRTRLCRPSWCLRCPAVV